MSTGPRVVIADDHAPTRAGIRGALEDEGCVVCGEASNARRAVELVTELRPDAALLDIHMPGNGIAAAQEISRACPEVAVVMLTYSRDDDDLFDALRAGASGYLVKDMNPARLAHALRGVLAGEAALPRDLAARVLDEFRERPRRRFTRARSASKLTSREWEVMDLLREGLTTEQVAQRLFLSPNTVRVHVSSVLRKLHVKTRDEAFQQLDGG